MTKRMLIDATHPEETRVAVVNGNKLEEYDFETLSRKQLKSNIYLVKVTRVEPSLQAAFVDYGGNRHGFLPFPEIHPDYYRIPIADREAILAEERALAAAQAAKEEAEDQAQLAAAESRGFEEDETLELEIDENETIEEIEEGDEDYFHEDDEDLVIEPGYDLEMEIVADDETETPVKTIAKNITRKTIIDKDVLPEDSDDNGFMAETNIDEGDVLPENKSIIAGAKDNSITAIETDEDIANEGGLETEITEVVLEDNEVDNIGGDVIDAPTFRSNRQKRYKIQEVIKRNQIMLIQISKEERGNKGAAVTSYISLPGRYCVLMPNSPRGGGVSRKVSNIKDRQRLKKILNSLNVPDGMSVILRTAGVARNEAEISRDLEYLLRLWNQIRELTLKSTAPALIYEEGNLIKRAIRDLYKRDIDELWVAGEEAYNMAKDFMNTLVPGNEDKIHLYKETNVPLFFRYQVESQIDEIYSTNVQLKSGGYIVINPTEALVSIDVNSGKATKGRHIEETALKTNLEAAEEIARQVRLRDQGGLVVIDFIDMEDPRNNRIVERKLKNAMQGDRARIQIGRISPFGLMELSRQRLNPSIVETSFELCKHCEGRGVVRTVETSGIRILRAIEEEGLKGKASEIQVNLPNEVALYIFNNKKDTLASIEEKFDMCILLHIDSSLLSTNFSIEVLKTVKSSRRDLKKYTQNPIKTIDMSDFESDEDAEDTISDDEGSENISFKDDDENGSRENRPRRRGRRGGRNRGKYRNNSTGDKEEFEGSEQNNEPATAADEGQNNDQPRKQKRRRNTRRKYNTKKDGSEQGSGGENDGESDRGRNSPENGKSAPAHSLPLNKPANEAQTERKGWWKRLTE